MVPEISDVAMRTRLPTSLIFVDQTDDLWNSNERTGSSSNARFTNKLRTPLILLNTSVICRSRDSVIYIIFKAVSTS